MKILQEPVRSETGTREVRVNAAPECGAGYVHVLIEHTQVPVTMAEALLTRESALDLANKLRKAAAGEEN